MIKNLYIRSLFPTLKHSLIPCLTTNQVIVQKFLSHKRIPVSFDQPCKSISADNNLFNEDEILEDIENDDFVISSEELEQIADDVASSLSKIDDIGYVSDNRLVQDPLNEPDISKMHTGNETASKPINQFREIVYNEGELDKSDLTKPPSHDNPHPFNPKFLPPTHARSLSAYVNYLPVLQRLIDIGVNLFQVDISSNIGRILIHKDWKNDIKPKIFWLVKDIGVNPNDLGLYLTRNPFFLIQDLSKLKKRVGYLYSKNFTKEFVAKIIIKNRFWLNMDEKIIDSRLGWIQRQFRLRGEEVRQLIIKEPRIIIFGIGPLQQLVLSLNKEMGFNSLQIKAMLKQDPRLFMITNPKTILMAYNYLTKVMLVSIDQIAAFPLALRCSSSDLRYRHEFLYRLNLSQYNPNLPKYISLQSLLHPSDKYFAENIANTFVEDYNKFLKFL